MEDMAVEVAALKQRQTVSEHRIADLEGEVKGHSDPDRRHGAGGRESRRSEGRRGRN